MRLTAYTDFTLHMLMYLALRPERSATVAEIAGAYGISIAHLNKVVQQSALAGEIGTVRGRNGGIRLARSPEAINLAEVVRRTEPDMDLAPCFADKGACVLGRCCLLERALRRASKVFFEELRRTTLADLIGPGGPSVKLFSPAAKERSAPSRKQALAGVSGRRTSVSAGAGRRRADA